MSNALAAKHALQRGGVDGRLAVGLSEGKQKERHVGRGWLASHRAEALVFLGLLHGRVVGDRPARLASVTDAYWVSIQLDQSGAIPIGQASLWSPESVTVRKRPSLLIAP